MVVRVGARVRIRAGKGILGEGKVRTMVRMRVLPFVPLVLRI